MTAALTATLVLSVGHAAADPGADGANAEPSLSSIAPATPVLPPASPEDLAAPAEQPDAQEPAEAPVQHARPAKPRKGGVHPCNTPDPGYGIYDRWSRNISMGQMIAPQAGGVTDKGGFDLIVHFHGHEPVRKEFVKSAKGIVLVGIDLGVGSGAYYSAFSSPDAFERLLTSVEREMARRSGKEKTFVRHLALSSWSAGYGAIAQILSQPAGKKVDAVILLDSVHSGYADASTKSLKPAQVEPFLAFAKKASKGDAFMFQSVSSIIPPGYASTREVAHFMVAELGGKMKKTKRDDVLGLEMDERFDSGNWHVRGYGGDDKPDHCAHLGLMKDVVRVHLNPRWKPPKGKKSAKAKESDDRDDKKSDRDDEPVARAGEQVHTVGDGQSLSRIAKRYHVTVDAIRERNGLDQGRKIQPGDKLVIPAASSKEKAKESKEKSKETSAKAAPAAASGPKLRAGEQLHTVGDGQSLSRIAKRYHVTVDAIRERNGLDQKRKIQPGDKLVIPAPGAKKTKSAKPTAEKKPEPKAEPKTEPAKAEPALDDASDDAATLGGGA
jgi:LysM repeat protein